MPEDICIMHLLCRIHAINNFSTKVKFCNGDGIDSIQIPFAKAYFGVKPFCKLFSYEIQILVHVSSKIGLLILQLDQ
jgi:hypothetical protein